MLIINDFDQFQGGGNPILTIKKYIKSIDMELVAPPPALSSNTTVRKAPQPPV
jgi:hypothetical protein